MVQWNKVRKLRIKKIISVTKTDCKGVSPHELYMLFRALLPQYRWSTLSWKLGVAMTTTSSVGIATISPWCTIVYRADRRNKLTNLTSKVAQKRWHCCKEHTNTWYQHIITTSSYFCFYIWTFHRCDFI